LRASMFASTYKANSPMTRHIIKNAQMNRILQNNPRDG